ncbi:MAG: KdsC family phosphatase [Salibacteraceae bacterium]
MNLPKLVITDIDGVWTDAGMYYDQQGNELKKFTTADSFGILLCREFDIPVAIITGEDTAIVANRAKKLKIEHLVQGSRDKVKDALEICANVGVTLNEVAYIGDDIGDYKLLKESGISATPQNGAPFLKDFVDIITETKGGEGAFREFIEIIFQKAGKYEIALEKLIAKS